VGFLFLGPEIGNSPRPPHRKNTEEKNSMVYTRREAAGEKQMSVVSAQSWDRELSVSERELLQEVVLALRTIRYGSVVLTVHDGRIVEINKTEKIRKSFA
jgi:hypothetical protein